MTSSLSELNTSDLQLVHELTESQVVAVHRLYQDQWWSGGRALENVQTALAHSSLIFGLVDRTNGALVAFCRVLTDFVFRGMLHDVMVDRAWQGRGVGSLLLDAVIAHPRLKDIDAIGLWCKPELEPLYQRYGFQRGNDAYLWMQRTSPRNPM